MKCKYCGGTGTSNTCVNGTFKPCSFCDGTGEFDPNEVDRFNAVDVIKVMEMVKKPQTNEEWLNGLPITDKASFLAKIVTDAIKEHGEHGVTRCESVIWWDEWLKQPHTIKE